MLYPQFVFKEYCKKHTLRYTPERDVIIEEIYRKDGHFDIDSLFLRIRNRYPKIKLAKGSIYRTVPHLIKAGLIREAFVENGHLYYEHILGHAHHDHMKCVSCGEIFEFYEEGIDKLQQEFCKQRKFEMLWHTHIIGGYCAMCSSKKQKKMRRLNARYKGC